MDDAVRTFLCLELPFEVQCAIWRATASLRAAYPDFKWVRSGCLHVTIKFLGERNLDFLNPFLLTLEERIISSSVPAFTLFSDSLGAFPDMRRVQTLFTRVHGELSHLKRIMSFVEEIAEAHAFPRESRPFMPHITIARTRRPELVSQTENVHNQKIEWRAQSITLMESILTPTGPVYAPLKNWRFRETDL